MTKEMTVGPIEKDVPIPSITRKTVYPFGVMEVGDSFHVVGHQRVRAAASYFGTRHGKRFVVRQEGNGFRVWRTK